jgi:hypothetical protein
MGGQKQQKQQAGDGHQLFLAHGGTEGLPNPVHRFYLLGCLVCATGRLADFY